MAAWGAQNLHAYRHAREAEAFERSTTVASLSQAEALFQAAIREDPGFAHAYRSLSGIYHALGMLSADTATRERIRRAMQDLLREASLRLSDADVIASIETQYRFLSSANAFDAEALWRGELLEDPKSVEALRRYGELLLGAKLIDESQRYFEHAIGHAPAQSHASLAAYYSSIATARGDHEESIRVLKSTLEHYPDYTLSLYGLVRALGALQRYPEATIYLEQLRGSDPAWAYAGELTLLAQRGAIQPGSPALIEAFANPQATNASRGIACFILGDVECGVRYWREIEPTFLPLEWQFISGEEKFWAPGVVEDPRYQALLDELGIGRRWRAYMRSKADELAPITGIALTSAPPLEDQAAYSR